MGHGVVHIDLPEAREPLPDFLFGKMPMPNEGSHSTLWSNAISVPGSRQTATFGSHRRVSE